MGFLKRLGNNFSSIQTKIALVTLLLVVLSITAIKVYDYTVRTREIERTVKEDRLNVAVLTASRLETEIFKAVSTLETAANNTAFASEDKEVVLKAMQAIKEQDKIFSTIIYIYPDLSRLNEKGELSSVANREYAQEVKKTKKTFISREILISQTTNKPSIMVATPVKVPGAPERYLGITINVDNLQHIVDETKKSDGNYAFAFDGKDGLVFAHPVKEYIGSLKFINPDEKSKQLVSPELQQMAAETSSGRSGTQIYSFNGAKTIAAYTSVPGTKIGVASRINYEEAMEPIRQERNSAVIITLLASLISAIIAMALAKIMADPIKSITDQANIIASGDFTSANSIAVDRSDEVGQLQKAFKGMGGMLKSTMEQIRQASAHIASSSEVLEASAEQSAQGAAQVAATVTEVASGAINQVNAIDSTVTTVKEMGNEIRQIANNASEVALLSKKSSDAAVEGGQAISHAIDSISSIKDIVQDTAGVIRELGVSSDRISEIADTITGIASQTNLLALNAAIEASRAGEQGRGFSVVADEVRKLAEQSRESAGNIAKIIGEVQSQTRYAIEKTDKSAQEVSTGHDVVLAAGESFKIIQRHIDDVSQAVNGITTTAQQLSVFSGNVIASVEKIREISQDTAAKSQAISVATEEQSASMQEVASSAESLARLSNQLEETLKMYKF
ncbi:MAG: HAMP domain-containing protein [Firmicutes bacterium]|nr:HAMP domain-containing protein [Bacillota bacterium]